MDVTVNSSAPSLTYLHRCFNSTAANFISVIFFMNHVFFIFPLSIVVLYLGYQQWRPQRSFATTRHSDIFTYHWAVMELILGLGAVMYACGRGFGVIELMTVGFYACSNFYFGPISFNVLTCVERYLAVVHPITYLSLRQSGGVMIRNISIGCAWLLYCGWFGLQMIYSSEVAYTPIFCLLVFSLVVVSFCSLSVLCVLTRPGPGEMGGNRKKKDKTKQKAFHTIVAITGVLWLLFVGLLVCVAVDNSHVLSSSDTCLVLNTTTCFTLPGSFVLPLLFLQRAGKQLCCHCNNN